MHGVNAGVRADVVADAGSADLRCDNAAQPRAPVNIRLRKDYNANVKTMPQQESEHYL
jgi:hypothetical protein